MRPRPGRWRYVLGVADATGPPEGARQARRAPLLEISNGVVGLHKRYYGKGPESCRAIYQGDVVVVVLRGTFTPLESTLVESGRAETVLEQRRALQEVVEDEMKLLVRTTVGRPVEAYLSANHVDPDAQVDVFLLERMD